MTFEIEMVNTTISATNIAQDTALARLYIFNSSIIQNQSPFGQNILQAIAIYITKTVHLMNTIAEIYITIG